MRWGETDFMMHGCVKTARGHMVYVDLLSSKTERNVYIYAEPVSRASQEIKTLPLVKGTVFPKKDKTKKPPKNTKGKKKIVRTIKGTVSPMESDRLVLSPGGLIWGRFFSFSTSHCPHL